jgi:hypothetical protein
MEPGLFLLGRIARLQIQRSALKLGQKPNRVYDPAPLLPVEALILTREGVLARLADGSVVVDVHHTGHPETRNSAGVNDVSVGFTAHYLAMRAGYGPHLVDGCAGENILVEAAEAIALRRVAGGLVIQGAGGRQAGLSNVRVALPCVEFSGYASRSTETMAIKAALQFLDDGRRGFYCTYEGAQAVELAVGDEVFAVADLTRM